MSEISDIPYEEEKAMRLWMKLYQARQRSVSEGEQIGIIKKAIEEVASDIKADCTSLHTADSTEISRLTENESRLLRAIESACHAWNMTPLEQRTPELQEAVNGLSKAHQDALRNS